jgi:hypothetical protein
VPVLNDSELRMVAEVLAEMARFRGTAFDKTAKGCAFARAALIDPAFTARLAEVPLHAGRQAASGSAVSRIRADAARMGRMAEAAGRDMGAPARGIQCHHARQCRGSETRVARHLPGVRGG